MEIDWGEGLGNVRRQDHNVAVKEEKLEGDTPQGCLQLA
jgi:hypothetical protein